MNSCYFNDFYIYAIRIKHFPYSGESADLAIDPLKEIPYVEH